MAPLAAVVFRVSKTHGVAQVNSLKVNRLRSSIIMRSSRTDLCIRQMVASKRSKTLTLRGVPLQTSPNYHRLLLPKTTAFSSQKISISRMESVWCPRMAMQRKMKRVKCNLAK